MTARATRPRSKSSARAPIAICGSSKAYNPGYSFPPQESLMPRLGFGAFLAPHHPVGEHPMLQFRRDLDLVEHLDKLGYDEFWCGEHHSSGWEMIASPEMFLAAAGERSKRLKLAPGVLSLPHHPPFNAAQRRVPPHYPTARPVIFAPPPPPPP